MKYFLDQTTSLWLNGALHGKPALCLPRQVRCMAVKESTLLTMLPPLFHHGMMIFRVEQCHSRIVTYETGGTPYGYETMSAGLDMISA